MKRRIRLTESDIHRIVKESVNRVLKEDSGLPRTNQENIGVVEAVRNLVKELEKVGADRKYIDMVHRIEWDFVDSFSVYVDDYDDNPKGIFVEKDGVIYLIQGGQNYLNNAEDLKSYIDWAMTNGKAEKTLFNPATLVKSGCTKILIMP